MIDPCAVPSPGSLNSSPSRTPTCRHLPSNRRNGGSATRIWSISTSLARTSCPYSSFVKPSTPTPASFCVPANERPTAPAPLCSVGSGCRVRSPTSSLLCGHPTPLPHLRASSLPSVALYQSNKRQFCVPRRLRRETGRRTACCRRRVGEDLRVSVARYLAWTVKGLPGYRAVLFGRATVVHPTGPPSARLVTPDRSFPLAVSTVSGFV